MISKRPARDADKAYARSQHHLAYRDVITRQFGGWDEAMQDRFFDSDWVTERFEIILDDGEPCGYYSTERNGAVTELVEVVLDAAHQGQGIGTRLVREEIAAAQQRGDRLILKTLHENRARKLYERLGFAVYGTTETHVLMEHRPPQA